jgi:glutamate decarboxylase
MERAIAYFASQPDHKPKQEGSHFSHWRLY